MTGYSDAAASAAAEGIDLLVKPYTLEALSNTLKGAMLGNVTHHLGLTRAFRAAPARSA